MGLDAVVYCNCFESGKLKEIPSYIDSIYVDSGGDLGCKNDNFETVLEFDQWLLYRACEHENGVLLHHYLGNIARVSNLRKDLSVNVERFPIILEKILYSGTHCGDFLRLETVKNLKKEIDYLEAFVCSNELSQERVSYFCKQLIELTNAALRVGKPILF
jgi:hypothetical protein